MKYLYFMSTFCQAICDGKYVIVIRTGFIKTKHLPNGSTARELFVKHKQELLPGSGRLTVLLISLPADSTTALLSTNIAKDFNDFTTIC